MAFRRVDAGGRPSSTPVSRGTLSANRRAVGDDGIIYGRAIEQLATIGREINPVPGDENSLFESVARQMNKIGYNSNMLRELVLHYGNRFADRYCCKFLCSHSIRDFKEKLSKLRHCWNESLADVVLVILKDSLMINLVVICDYTKPLKLPDNYCTGDFDTVVVVRDNLHPYFDSTRKRLAPGEPRLYCGSIAEQLEVLGRVIDPVPRVDNALLECVARQTKHVGHKPQELRDLAYEYGHLTIEKYCTLLSWPQSKVRQVLESMKTVTWFNSEIAELMLTVLQDVLQVKIVVLRHCCKPLKFPNDSCQITPDTVLMVQSSHGVIHYDSTKPKKKSQSHGNKSYCHSAGTRR